MTPEQWARVAELFESAVACPRDERDAWLDGACDDPGLRAEVRAMLAAHDRDPDFLEQAIDPRGSLEHAGHDALAGRRMGAYRLTHEIGRGGMGVVYEAVRDDQEFDRRAAVKVLPLWGADTLAERFRFERQVLAGLDHAGIARLIDAGTDTGGVPYCVMEFVEGQPLDQWCDTAQLDLLSRVRLFERVCEAVSYAHAHLVVHRDLKPSNILVTGDGQPKLLDFGIATLLDPTEGASVGTTRTGFTSFTPEFASPEQMRGERVTVATDVYSLGVLLYLLLTGRRPHELRELPPLEALRVVCEVEPQRPSQAAAPGRRAELAGDLDTIVGTALQKDRSRRYASVEALMADLRAWREHRPIAAAPPSWGYLASRFVRRHPGGVASAVALLTVVLVGAAATAWQARVAERERARADARFSDVRQLANAVVGPLYDAIARVPGSTEARQTLVKEALTYLDRLSAQAGDDIELTRELADAYQKIGDVQGNLFGANLGDTAGAKVSYARLMALRRAVDAARPGDAAARRGVATAEMRLADIALGEGRSPDAIAGYERAIALLDERIRAAGGEAAAIDVANANNRFGVALNWAGRPRDAIEAFNRSRAAIAPWVQRANPTEAALTELRSALGNQGDVYYYSQQYEQAHANFAEALTLAREAAARANTAQAQRAVHLIATRVGAALSELGRLDEAAVFSAEGLAIQRELAVADAKNVRLQFDLAASLQTHGVIEFRRARYPEAEALMRQSLDMYEGGVKASPSSDQRFDIAGTQAWLGRTLSKRGRHREAVAALAASVEMYAVPDVAARNPGERAEALQLFGDAAAAWARDGGGDAARQQARSAYLSARDVVASIERSGELEPEVVAIRRQIDLGLAALDRR